MSFVLNFVANEKRATLSRATSRRFGLRPMNGVLTRMAAIWRPSTARRTTRERLKSASVQRYILNAGSGHP